MLPSVFASPLTIKPKPMNTSNAMKLSTIISKNVIQPWTSVNWKAKCPIPIIIMAVINWKITLLNPSPRTIAVLLTGVAKKALDDQLLPEVEKKEGYPKYACTQ